ncbi:MAG TPA: glycosyltransferase family 39 protein [Stellaceae bacterium]|nr:glycosyltransferase family 39 protein [Stellaceae bacterium]
MGALDGWLTGFRPYLLLAGFCLLLYAPGIAATPPLDRDEARFAQATRQMLETGDFLRIRFQDEARNRKPAGIYWLQAASVEMFSSPESRAIWPYRLVSVIGASGAVLATFAFGCALFRTETAPRRSAFAAAALLAGTLGVAVEAHIAKTDAMLLAAIVAAQGALGLAYLRARDGRPVAFWVAAVFWIAEAAAILLKGPPAPMLAIVTAAALSIADRDARWLRGLRPAVGIALLVLLLAPWLIAIQNATGGRFLAESLGRDLFTKLIGAQESHGAPPLSYLALAIVTLWPASLFLVPAMLRVWRRRQAPAERFLLAWIVPAWVLLELVPTKLPHYALPLYPAIALAAGAALAGFVPLGRASWAARIDIAVRSLWAIATLTLAAALIVLPIRFGTGPEFVGVFGAALIVAIAALLLYRAPSLAALPLLGALSLAFIGIAAAGVLPSLDRLWLSRSAASLVETHPPARGEPLVAVGYSEPSLVFLLGTDLRLAGAGAAAETLSNGGEALVSGREDPIFHQSLAARGLVADRIGETRGLDYSNGQHMVLTLYVVRRG